MTSDVSRRGRNAYDPDLLASVQDELAFALRSLDELETEHAEGQLSEATYRRLHAAYTVRAADAARSRRDLSRRRPAVSARPRRVKVIASLVLAVLVIGVGVSLHLGSRSRPAGGTITGDAAASLDTSARQRALDARAEQALVNGDLSGALKGYIAALRADPRDVEALTYTGWLTFLAGSTHQAVPLLKAAVRTDASYPDAHAFLGIVLLRSHRQQDLATAQLRQYLRLVPSGQMSQQVRRVLQVATKSSRTRGRPAR